MKFVILVALGSVLQTVSSVRAQPIPFKEPVLLDLSRTFATGLYAVGAMTAKKTIINSNLKMSREAFWKAQHENADLTSATETYAQALLAKDMHHYSTFVRSSLARGAGGAMGGQMVQSMNAFDRLSGDVEPIHEPAYQEYRTWAQAFMEAHLKTKDETDAFKAVLTQYNAYGSRRDLLERLFGSPYSPIIQDRDPLAYAQGLFSLIVVAKNIGPERPGSRFVKTERGYLPAREALLRAQDIQRKYGKEAFAQAIQTIYSYQSIAGFEIDIPTTIQYDKLVAHLAKLKSGDNSDGEPPRSSLSSPTSVLSTARLILRSSGIRTSSIPGQPGRVQFWAFGVPENLDEIERLMTTGETNWDAGPLREAERRLIGLAEKVQKPQVAQGRGNRRPSVLAPGNTVPPEFLTALDSIGRSLTLNLRLVEATALWQGKSKTRQ